jgi:protocatechuate 3,4-dioxygenase beta subunit
VPRESLAPPFDRAAWIRVGVVSALLLLVPILAWIFLARPPPAPSVVSAPAPSTLAIAKPVRSAPPLAGRSITGKVIDETGAPAAGVTVTFTPNGKATGRYKMRSDEDGTFFLDGVPEDAGSLSGKKHGYTSTPLAIEAGSDDVTGLTLTVRASQGVKGQVVDGDGKPVDHAIVKCAGDDGASATSGSDGTFELDIDAEGCDAIASHPDYGSSDPSHLRAGSNNVLALPSPGGIAGVVVDEQGKPVPSYMIAMESFVPADKDVDPLGGLSQNVTDPGGAFELGGLARGKYVLTASAPGRPPQRSDSIEVTSGRTTRGVRIVLGRGLVLSGTVVDRSTHKPIAGARVALDAVTSTGVNRVPPVTTDDAGAFTIDGAPTAAFSIRVTAPDYRDRILTLDGSGKRELRADVDLAPGGGSTEMTGIGATLGQAAGYVFISGVVPDGPAEKAGVKQGDRIARIDGQSAETFSVSDCISRLRGPEGTTVVLTAERNGAQIDIPITRALIVR